MKVAILSQYYQPEIGAPQARLAGLAAILAESGHEVTVLTALPSYPTGSIHPGYRTLFRREQLGGATVLHCPLYPTKDLRLLPRLLSYFSFALSSLVVGLVLLPKVDFLLTESPPLFLGPTGFVLSRCKGGRWIFNVSDLWPESAVRLGLIGEGWGLRAAQALEAFCYRRAWCVTGQTREIVDDIARRFPGVRTYHLPNAVDTSRFAPCFRNEAVRARLAPEGTFLAVYAGLHGAAQGLGCVVEAAAMLADVEGLSVVLVGDGPTKKQLMAESDARKLKNVTFLAPIKHHEVPEVLASSDAALVVLGVALIGAVPSKLYEAMASGVPVVLAAGGEAATIVEGAGAGIVVSPGDAEGLATALRRLAGDRTEATTMGRLGREAAVARYDRRSTVALFVDFLLGVTEERAEEEHGRPRLVGNAESWEASA